MRDLIPSLGPPMALPSTPARVIIYSSDSDMQQLLALSESVSWMEALPWPGAGSRDHPCALKTEALHPGMTWVPVQIHKAETVGLSKSSPMAGALQGLLDEAKDPEGDSSPDRGHTTGVPPTSAKPALDRGEGGPNVIDEDVNQAMAGYRHSDKGGLPPSLYADFLALIGKPEAGVKGVGLSSAAAKTLLRRFGSIEGIAEAARLGAVDSNLRIKQISSKQPKSSALSQAMEAEPSENGASQRLQQALRNVRATRIRCDTASVPWDTVRSSVHDLSKKELLLSARQGEAWPHTLTRATGIAAVNADNSSEVERHSLLTATLYPHNLFHSLSALPYIEVIGSHLASCGVDHHRNVLAPSGLVLDIDLMGQSAAIVVLAPSDFLRPMVVTSTPVLGGTMPRGGSTDTGPRSGSGSDSISDDGSRELDHLPQKLKGSLTGIAQMRIKQVRRERARVALMPFFDAFQHHSGGDGQDVIGLKDDHAMRLTGWITMNTKC